MMLRVVVQAVLAILLISAASPAPAETPAAPAPARPDMAKLKNPVWTSTDNLRDPSVLKLGDGYLVFYSRFSGPKWSDPNAWAVASTFTRDFVHFEGDRDVSAKGFASPDAPVMWHGRYVLAYQSYPVAPARLCFSESKDARTWSAPKVFLDEARRLPWNEQRRLIDPTLVVDGDMLHCFFVGSAMHTGADGKARRANLLGHAVTRDPAMEKWEILTADAPMIGVSDRAPDGVENVTVYKVGAEWLMVYSEGLAAQHLALASSKDLRTWKLDGPIAIDKQQWIAVKYGAPFVWKDDDGWMMILMGESSRGRTTFGLLTSADGRRWTLLPE
jgi:sucrose-6-phosphate hydrolase SacC (GH32 family)